MTQDSPATEMLHSPGETVRGETRQFVTFTLGSQAYCADIMSVREIRASNVVTPLPSAPEYVRGVINLRGTIVPIIDLRVRFGLGRTETASSHVVMIVAVEGRLHGLLVDGVSDILTEHISNIKTIPETIGENRNPFFDGLITQGDSMLIVLSLPRLVRTSQPPISTTPDRPAVNSLPAA